MTIRHLVATLMIAIAAQTGFLMMTPMAQAGSYQSNGTYAGTPSPAVAGLFAAFPNGGDGLSDGIRTLLLANPELADDIAYLASQGSVAQQSAAATGMAQAFLVLTQRGNTAGASLLVGAAQRSGISTIQNALNAAVGTSTVYAGQSGNPVTGQANCRTPVSPAAPTTCQ